MRSVSRRRRLIGRGLLLRGGIGFAGQFPNVMTFAREPEHQRAKGKCEAGFAKKLSHKVRHSKRRALGRAREKIDIVIVLVLMLVIEVSNDPEHDYELKGHPAGLL